MVKFIKNINMKKYLIIPLFSIIMLLGCKKEKPYDFTDTESNVEIYMPQAINKPTNLVSIYKPILSTDPVNTIVNFGSYFGGYHVATNDVSTTFVINANALVAINKVETDAGRAPYIILPQNLYTLPSLTTTIKTGKHSSDVLNISIDNKSIPTGSKYALPITLSSSSGLSISSKLNTTVFVFDVPDPWSKFAGNYMLTGRFTHPTASSSRDLNLTAAVTYVGNQTFNSPVADLGGSNYFINIKINANNTVTLTNLGAMPNVDQTVGPNTFDPLTKTFILNFSYTPAGGLPRIVNQKMVQQ